MNRLTLTFVSVVLAVYIPAIAQQPCAAPPPVIAAQENIFSPEQETILGDIIAEQVERDFRLVKDDKLNQYLQEIGQRLLVHLPTRLKITIRLVDIADVNAYTLPGGHVYVTRKLVAFVQSEDELAGVLGHEIGHALAGHPAVTESAEFKTILGVTSVGDRADIAAKYNRLLDNRARFKQQVREDEHLQIQADRLALYALARSGYDVESFSQVWDRLAQTKGRTGSWLSDLFGTTSSGARRLREVIKSAAAIPRECIEPPLANRTSRFSEFRTSVIEYSDGVQQASLHGVLRQVRLSPPLRPDIDAVRFSPDGKFVMAQDESGIYVLTREPFALLFRIDAPNAHEALFTPDSQSLVFSNESLRVEKWSVADKARISVHEVALPQSCFHSRLSPDGSILVCYGTDLTLRLVEVETGKLLVEKTNFTRLYYWELQHLSEGFELAILSRIVFSPDGRYLIATDSHYSDLHYLAYDLSKREEFRLSHAVTKIIAHPFDFLSADRIVGGTESNDAIVARFPSGDVLQRTQLGDASPTSATHGDYVLIKPVKDHVLGVLDLKRNQFVLANDSPALDLYDDMIVGEMKSGSLALFRMGSTTPVGQVALPEARLEHFRVAALSPDSEHIALSERSRSGVWELTTGRQRFRLRGVRGAWFSDDGTLFADFPKDDVEKQPRNMLHIDLTTGKGSVSYRIAEGSDSRDDSKNNAAQVPPKWWVYQAGPVLCTWKPSVKDDTLDQNVDLDISDIASGKLLWSRHFPKERPHLYFDPQSAELIFAWQFSTSAAKQEITADPALSARVAELSDRATAVLLEVLSGRTGAVIGHIAVDTGKASFRITDVEGNGDLVKVHDNQNRILFYSAATGKQIGSIFSDGISEISADGNALAVVNAEYELTLYSLPSLEKTDTLRFPEPISWFHFARDSKHLFVLTRDQTAYTLDLSASGSRATSSVLPQASTP
jgi:WD40 repeat protein